jgi:hypothetical protein
VVTQGEDKPKKAQTEPLSNRANRLSSFRDKAERSPRTFVRADIEGNLVGLASKPVFQGFPENQVSTSYQDPHRVPPLSGTTMIFAPAIV